MVVSFLLNFMVSILVSLFLLGFFFYVSLGSIKRNGWCFKVIFVVNPFFSVGFVRYDNESDLSL